MTPTAVLTSLQKVKVLADLASRIFRQGLDIAIDESDGECPWEAKDIRQISGAAFDKCSDADSLSIMLEPDVRTAVDVILAQIKGRRRAASQKIRTQRPRARATERWATSNTGGVWVGVTVEYNIYYDSTQMLVCTEYGFTDPAPAPAPAAAEVKKVGPPPAPEEKPGVLPGPATPEPAKV